LNTKNIFLFDTETVGLNPRNFIYDIGWHITDRYGNIKKKRNYLIEEVITDGSKMMSAFYAKKIFSFYIPAIDSNKIRLTPFANVMDIMYADLQECKTIAAYNIGFDLAALKNTVEVLQHSWEPVFDDYKKLCLWTFSCQALLSNRNYIKYARKQGWRSKAGNYKTGAEHSYRYITKQPHFIESHTALDDCDIENKIMVEAFKRKKTIPYNKYNCSPWRMVQPAQQLEQMKFARRATQLELF